MADIDSGQVPVLSDVQIRWEYRTVWADNLWFVRTDIDQSGHMNTDKMGFVEYLNHLGQSGWELVQVLPVERGFRALLKRMI